MDFKVQTLFNFKTDYNADSVEWCPQEPHQNLFVCANYQLLEKQEQEAINKRLGKLLLFSVSPEKGLILLQTINTFAVLDQKWCHKKINNTIVLGVTNAERRIEIYKLNEVTLHLELITFCTVDFDDTETLVLSLDWSTGIIHSETPEIICSDSKGNVHLLHFNNNDLKLITSWHGHDFEAWIAGFYYWDTNIFFSGGDDSIFFKFDRRVGNDPVSKNKSHEAGVTSFHSNSSREYLVATGSYDEFVRLWDIRKMKTEIESIKMPGTLWRLKWDPFSQTKLLAACMYGGLHIIDANSEKMSIIGSYDEHKNIVYGADWSYLNKDECRKFQQQGEVIIGSCSFYDSLLCISKVDI